MNECYECKYKGSVAGSCHSSCQHPSFDKVRNDPMLSILAMVGNLPGKLPILLENPDCKVVGDPHGIKNGWFNHPFDFDPVWLKECSGFEQS